MGDWLFIKEYYCLVKKHKKANHNHNAGGYMFFSCFCLIYGLTNIQILDER